MQVSLYQKYPCLPCVAPTLISSLVQWSHMSGIETFHPAKKPMKSCGCFELSDDTASASMKIVWGRAFLSDTAKCVFCSICSLVGAYRTSALNVEGGDDE